jgi:hypothetical protein
MDESNHAARTVSGLALGMDALSMRQNARAFARSRHRISLDAEILEGRALLSAAQPSNGALRTNGLHDIAIKVPSTYVSQQSAAIYVTLVRTGSSATLSNQSLTVDFSAQLGTVAGGDQVESATAADSFTPVNEPVTFASGQTTTTIAVPVNAAAAGTGLTPVQIAVASPSHPRQQSSATVYLTSGPDAVPPVITSVHLVPNGLSITFSKPMAPATVENLHNYKVVFHPSQAADTLAYNAAVGTYTDFVTPPHRVMFRGAKYDPATDTVVLLMRQTPGTQGSYRISSPPSLGTRRAAADKVAPLSDTEGNPLAASGSHVPGYFAFTIYRGHPYVAAQPTYSVEADEDRGTITGADIVSD